jgi:hypothetical protein
MTARKSHHTPTVPQAYEQQRERYVERVICFLADCHAAEPTAQSVPLSDVRAFLHMSSASAFLRPVLARLQERDLVTVVAGADADRLLYLTPRFIELAESREEADAVHRA